MKVDSGFAGTLDLPGLRDLATTTEQAGYDALLLGETSSDAFVSAAIAIEHSQRIEVATAIAVAFARNPMSVAYAAHDLQRLSGGRFVLGLGTQVRAHVDRRFSMPWSRPADRIREFVTAVRAIWQCWNEGTPLQFEGEFYRHTLMTPFWSPPPDEHGPPRVFLSALGPRVTQAAAEVADGAFIHDFSTDRYLREVTLPAVERGLAVAGRERESFEVAVPLLLVSGRDEAAMARAARSARGTIAFYGSTAAFRHVLELHGWGEVQDRLHALAKQGRWDDMADAIDDDVLRAFAIVAEPDRIAEQVLTRFGDLVDRCNFVAPELDVHTLSRVVDSIRRTPNPKEAS